MKVRAFIWIALLDRLNKCDILQRKGPQTAIYPSICVMCMRNGEKNPHLFLHDYVSRALCYSITSLPLIRFRGFGPERDLKILWKCAIHAIRWAVWLERNNWISLSKSNDVAMLLDREVIMKPGSMYVPERSKSVYARPPSLVDLCVQTAIDNVRYLGDVGETDIYLLDRILPHCTVDQLMHVENETVGRDLSQITNKLWKKFYEAKFGAEHTNDVVERMRRTRQKFSWRQLYQAKLKVQDEAQKQSLERLTQLYKKEDERRQSRQIQICSKAPPSSKKRFFGCGFGGSSPVVAKSNIMKKAKIEYRNSHEIKNRAAIKRNLALRSPVVPARPSISAYRPNTSQGRPGGSSQLKGGSASASRLPIKDREDDVRRNPLVASKGKASSMPGKSSTARPKGKEVDWDDDIRSKLDEFW